MKYIKTFESFADKDVKQQLRILKSYQLSLKKLHTI